MFKFIGGDYTEYTGMNINSAFCCLIMIITFIRIYRVLSLILPEIVIKPLKYVSHNINKFYCVSYVLIMGTSYITEIELTRDIDAIKAWLIVSFLTAGIIIFCKKCLEVNFANFFAKHKLFWILLAWILSIAAACFAFSSFDTLPNFLNYYLGYEQHKKDDRQPKIICRLKISYAS